MKQSYILGGVLLALFAVLCFSGCGSNWVVPECDCPDLSVPYNDNESSGEETSPTLELTVPDDSEAEPDAGTEPEVCLPGWGLGDDNHCHVFQHDAGSNEKPECKNGWGWGDDNHCHIKTCKKFKGGN